MLGKFKLERKFLVSNFFIKILRAVLKFRNIFELELQKGKKERFGMFGRRKIFIVDDKENVFVKESVLVLVEKRFVFREYKRFKSEKF